MVLRQNRPLQQELTAADRTAFEQFLVQLRDHFEAYHARKENVAWTITSFFISGMVALLVILITNSTLQTYLRWLPFSISITVLILLTATGVGLFVNREFANRIVASEFVAACGALLAQLADPNQRFNYDDVRPIDQEHNRNQEPYILPKALWEQMRINESMRAKRRHRLGRLVHSILQTKLWRFITLGNWGMIIPCAVIIAIPGVLIVFVAATAVGGFQPAFTPTPTVATQVPSSTIAPVLTHTPIPLSTARATP